MKRIITLIVLVFILLSSLLHCYAEEVPFYPGVYHVGVDFKAGDYNLRFKNTHTYFDSMVGVEIYKTEEDFQNSNYFAFGSFSSSGYHLHVEDGMVFCVVILGDGILAIAPVESSWTP